MCGGHGYVSMCFRTRVRAYPCSAGENVRSSMHPFLRFFLFLGGDLELPPLFLVSDMSTNLTRRFRDERSELEGTARNDKKARASRDERGRFRDDSN